MEDIRTTVNGEAESSGIQSYYLLVAEGRELPLSDLFSPDKVFIPHLAMVTAIETSFTRPRALTYNRF